MPVRGATAQAAAIRGSSGGGIFAHTMTITRDLGPTGTPSNIAVPWDAAYYLSTRASSRFVVVVEESAGNYQPNHVYSFGKTGTVSARGPQEYSTASWEYQDNVEASWTTFAADQTANVIVALRGEPITSAVIWPANLNITRQVSGGFLFLQVPQDVRLLIEVNGNTKDTLCVYSDPLSVDAVPAPAGASTITISDQAGLSTNSAQIEVGGTQNNPLVVVFNPGVYDAPTTAGTVAAPAGFTSVTRELDHMLWKVGPYTHIHLKRGAWFVGSMDWRGTNDGSLTGAGTISGEWATWSDMLTKLQGDQSQYQNPLNFLTFNQQVAWSALVGTTYDDNDFVFPNLACSGVSLVGHPFYTAAGPFNTYLRVKIISHWLYNCDGFSGLTLNPNNDYTRSCTKSFCMSGDDGMQMDFNYGDTFYTDCHVITYGGSPVHFGYWSEAPDTSRPDNKRVVTNCTVQTRSNGVAYGRDLYSGKNTDELGGTAPNQWSAQDVGPNSNWTTYGPYAHPTSFTESVIKAWMDGDNDEPKNWGKFNVTIDGLYVENAVPTALFSMENCFYPFGFVSSQNLSTPYQADKAGNASNWVIKNVFVQNAPTWRSRLIGRDKLNTFHNISFSNINIAGTRLSVRNWDQYVVQNEAPYNIFVEGRAVVTAVDICNLALSHIGESATVTSIAPPDGSAQSILCNQFFNRAVEELLEMHPWSFATARADLAETATNDVDGWKYSYAYPPAGTEIVRTLQVLPDGYKDTYTEQMTKMQPAYTIEQASTGSLVLYTDLEDAEVRYVKFVYTPGFYPPLFITTLSWLLASKLAGPIMKGDVGSAEAKRCLQMMQFYLGKAAGSDSNQRITDTNHSAPWISGR